jgi:hypothetical protein
MRRYAFFLRKLNPAQFELSGHPFAKWLGGWPPFFLDHPLPFSCGSRLMCRIIAK